MEARITTHVEKKGEPLKIWMRGRASTTDNSSKK